MEGLSAMRGSSQTFLARILPNNNILMDAGDIHQKEFVRGEKLRPQIESTEEKSLSRSLVFFFPKWFT